MVGKCIGTVHRFKSPILPLREVWKLVWCLNIFSLFEALTVAENISLGIFLELAGPGLEEQIVQISKQYGLPLDPCRCVHLLSVGERQRIEIVRRLLNIQSC